MGDFSQAYKGDSYIAKSKHMLQSYAQVSGRDKASPQPGGESSKLPQLRQGVNPGSMPALMPGFN